MQEIEKLEAGLEYNFYDEKVVACKKMSLYCVRNIIQ